MDRPNGIILVTGSSGFIGSAVVRRLAREYTVIGLDREGDPHPPIEAECVSMDVTEEESVRTALARVRYAHGERIASVVHLAAYYDFSGEPSPRYEQVTVRGTERLLRRLREFQVEQSVFSSTMLIHTPSQPGERIDEGSPVKGKWDYPQSKIDTEQLIRAERGGIPAVLLRIAGETVREAGRRKSAPIGRCGKQRPVWPIGGGARGERLGLRSGTALGRAGVWRAEPRSSRGVARRHASTRSLRRRSDHVPRDGPLLRGGGVGSDGRPGDGHERSVARFIAADAERPGLHARAPRRSRR